MKKRFLAAVLCSLTLPLLAAVTPFAYFSRTDGRPLLIPEVREYHAAEGVAKFPAELSVAVPAGEELVAGQIAEELRRFGGSSVSTPVRNGGAIFTSAGMADTAR